MVKRTAAGKKVDYDQIAPTYNRRYAEGDGLSGVSGALRDLIDAVRPARVLEVGCGTGHWLAELRSYGVQPHGLDFSPGMLAQAQLRKAQLHLVNGRGGMLPFANATFDIVYAVNAIHHFDRQHHFILEAGRLLKPGGALAVIGMDPRSLRDNWYVYRYFEGTYEADLARFPSWPVVRGWVAEAGLTHIERRRVEEIHDAKIGRAVFDDPFLRKDQVSQLALLSDAAYEAGLKRMEAALGEAEARGETLTFPADFYLDMLSAYNM